MPIIHDTNAGIAHWRIEGEMTIYTAAELATQLLPLLTPPSDLEIDLSHVTEMDSAGLQLLMLAKRETVQSGRPLRLIKHSQAVLDTFELCDLAAYFGDPLVLAANSH
ncbi:MULTISPECIES: STAS domain-containing protein [unclassified Pseudomonas]|uniref:STAS domain-containing protein n=1 Tax=unclassified Pseudomonas TaxID=196821 RepID=UPI002AC93658|nr:MULTISPECIES: STAS domain-containing protein [unclassified Pseudomonas]MEB0040798.1 STAS domain-containing protein [Pseudomonas sp. MH10]MEB0122967.1 STAS domain-containing protein [Pseudomonas sp. CCI1.2]WPX65053.1 STAS domain-containing protein [Pseudomonas sp. MH10]